MYKLLNTLNQALLLLMSDDRCIEKMNFKIKTRVLVTTKHFRLRERSRIIYSILSINIRMVFRLGRSIRINLNIILIQLKSI
jgi:hypothetical protein